MLSSFKRNDYSPSVRNLIRKYGMHRIVSITIGRNPLNTLLNNFARFFSINKSYEKYFHLFMIVTLDNGKKLVIEKNEVINISERLPQKSNLIEYKEVPMSHNPTLYDFLENSRRNHKDYFMYKAVGNNCQNFINNLLTFNNLNNPELMFFIMQNVQDIVEGNVYLRKFMNSATDIAAVGDRIIHGSSIRKKTVIKKKRIYK